MLKKIMEGKGCALFTLFRGGKGIVSPNRMIGLLTAAGIFLFLAVDVFAWDMPKLGGGNENVDVKGLLGRSDKLMELVMDANEKLGLGLADVLTMTGKTGDAEKLREDIAAIKAKGKGKEGAEALIAKLDGSFSGFNKAGLRKSLEEAGTRLISGTSIGSAVMNIKSALESDKKAADESKALSEELTNAVKSASKNPSLAGSAGDLQSALDSVKLVADSVPKQVQYGADILTELLNFAKAHAIALK